MRTLRNIILRCVSDGLWFVDVIFIVFLTLSNFEVSFWTCFWRFKIEKCHFTRRFGGPFHQTLYLCTGEPWTRRAPFPAMDRVLFISVLEPYTLRHVEGIIRMTSARTLNNLCWQQFGHLAALGRLLERNVKVTLFVAFARDVWGSPARRPGCPINTARTPQARAV